MKARVHLAEIHPDCGRLDVAEGLLTPVAACADPEVPWRLADVMTAGARRAEAEALLRAARSGFESLLARYPLAFADHGAEFYAGSGDDPGKAFALATMNLANRPTLRAFEQAFAAAMRVDDLQSASAILAAAVEKWGGARGFRSSPLEERASALTAAGAGPRAAVPGQEPENSGGDT